MERYLAALILLLSGYLSATTVTGTIQDTNGNRYANGTVSAFSVITGASMTPAATDANGTFSITLTPSTYTFTVCAKPVNIGPNGGTSVTQVCAQPATPIVISGGSQDVSTQINAVAPILGPSISALLGANNAFTGNNSHAGTETMNGQTTFNGLVALNNILTGAGSAAIAGTFGGSPTTTGNWTMQGNNSFTGSNTYQGPVTGSGDNPLVWGGSLSAARIFGWRDITSSKFGGVGDGVTSNVAAFNAACTDAFAVGAPVYIPPGNFSVPTTPASCVGNNMKFIGAGKVATTITLGAGAYLVDDPNGWVSFEMRDLKFEGGAGAVRSRFSGANVNGQYEIFGCYFHNFTGAAISDNSSDMPYWKIYENIFQAANTTTSIGAALSGLSDTSWIESNAFINYAIGVKLFGGGNNVHIDANEFLEFSAGTNRAAIWLVPQTSYSNAGYGMTISHNKFGVENLDATDKRVLYADESTGTFFGDRLYKTTASTGFIAGNRFHDNAVNGGPAGGTSFIYTYTPNLSGNNYGAVFSGGTPVNYMLQYDASILPLTNDTLDVNNIIGPIVLADTAGVSAYNFTKETNAVGAGWIQDTQGDLSFNDSTEPSPLITATGQASFTNLQTGGIAAYGTQAGVTFGTVTDSVGGTDAIEATWTANAGVLKTFTTLPIAGVPIWVDFELQAGSSSPLATFNLEIFDVTNNKIVWQRLINLPGAGAGWKRYRLRWVPRNVPAGNFNLIFSNNSSNFGSGATGKIDVGRVFIYQSFEPLGGNQQFGIQTLQAAGSANGFRITPASPAASRTLNVPDPGGTDSFVFAAATQTLTNKSTSAGAVVGTVGSATGATAGTAIGAGTSQTLAITVTGALTTDVAQCSTNAAYPATWLTGITVLPPVVTANTVTLTLTNPSAGSITPAAQTFRCTVTR